MCSTGFQPVRVWKLPPGAFQRPIPFLHRSGERRSSPRRTTLAETRSLPPHAAPARWVAKSNHPPPTPPLPRGGYGAVETSLPVNPGECQGMARGPSIRGKPPLNEAAARRNASPLGRNSLRRETGSEARYSRTTTREIMSASSVTLLWHCSSVRWIACCSSRPAVCVSVG